MVLEHSLYTI